MIKNYRIYYTFHANAMQTPPTPRQRIRRRRRSKGKGVWMQNYFEKNWLPHCMKVKK